MPLKESMSGEVRKPVPCRCQQDASSKIWIEGPDAKSNGRYWLIDGRELDMPSGTLCEVEFHCTSQIKRISWKQAHA